MCKDVLLVGYVVHEKGNNNYYKLKIAQNIKPTTNIQLKQTKNHATKSRQQ